MRGRTRDTIATYENFGQISLHNGMGFVHIITWTAVLSALALVGQGAPLSKNCGVEDAEQSDDVTRRRVARAADGRTSAEILLSRPKVIELSLICDTQCYETLTNQQKVPEVFLSEAVREGSKRMSALGTTIVLSELHVWTHKDLIEITTDANVLIDRTRTFRETALLPRHWTDVTILVTGGLLYQSTNEIEGLMSSSSICTENGAGLLNYINPTLGKFAHNLVHELGHAVGMNHDYNSACQCEYGLGGCVMTPTASVAAITYFTWSSCSLDEYAALLGHQHTQCLYNPPNAVYNVTMLASMTCGNGIVEEGEECDCGGGCVDSCCLCCSSTCQILRNGNCAQGPCCNTATCMYHGTSTLCKQTQNADCGEDQYCTGDSNQCPDTSHESDGNNCTDTGGEASYCLGGQCTTRNNQCKRFWTDNYNSGADACYEYGINSAGFYANCGAPGVNGATSYTSCSSDGNPYYKCGTLQCAWPGSTQMYADTSPYRNPQDNSRVPNAQCRILNYGIWETPESGPVYVDDGAKCGENKACLDKNCLDKDEVFDALGLPPPAGPTYCGNGLVEEGEECDCGARAQECGCCAPDTCMFLPMNATCEHNECGLCTGHDPDCTEQKPNLTPCDENRGQCFKQECKSTNLQCKKYFEDEAAVAATDVMVYNSRFNMTQWNAGGYLLKLNNAWQSGGEFVQADGDGLCGVLLCNSTKTAHLYGPFHTRLTTSTFFLQPEFFSGTKCVFKRVENVRNRTLNYHKYLPLLVEHGSPCSIGDEHGYCATNRIKIDRFGMTSYMRAECVV